MKRSLRWMLVLAPVLLLFVGVPLGVSLAQRAALATAETAAGGILVNVAATPTNAPLQGPRAPTYAPRVGPRVPTYAPSFVGPRAPTYAPRLGPTAPAAASAVATKSGTPAPTSNAQTGLSGTVVALEADRFTVFTKAQRTAVVLVDPGKTTIRFNNKTVMLATLRIGDDVTVLGHRGEANAFHADLIRIVRDASATDPATPR